jgi:hypothetical protein
MTGNRIERARAAAELVHMTVAEEELAEVADRFDSLLSAMHQLASLELSEIQPLTLFPDEPDHVA